MDSVTFKMNSLVSEIRRGLWALDVTNIQAYAPIVEQFLAHKTLDFKGIGRATSLFSIVDNTGRAKSEDRDGALEIPPNSVAIVSMEGEIIRNGDYCTYGADEIVDSLYKAQSHPNIDATVLYVNGPGGAVSAIDLFRDFKAYKTKPIVGLAADALSLHFWTMVELCDFKMSDGNVSPRFGSIGVLATFMDFVKALADQGIIKHEIYSKLSDHKNLAFINALKGEYEMLQAELLDPLARKFQESVITGCPNLLQETGVLSGKTFYAEEAVRLGLIDAVGSMNLAVAKARGLALKSTIKTIN